MMYELRFNGAIINSVVTLALCRRRYIRILTKQTPACASEATLALQLTIQL